VAEAGEGRRRAEGNTASKTRPGHSAGSDASSALGRVREVARRDKDARFTALLHHVSLARLRAAYWAIRPQAAPGVDGVTWIDYGRDLEANLSGPAHTGAGRALPGQAEQAGVHPRRRTGGNGRSALGKFLEHRIADKRVLRLIGKWLAAGVIEDGRWTAGEEGSPQGASVSPLLANVYLHYVYDLWVDWWRRRHAHGEVITVRFADDCAPRTLKEVSV
jgi:hypothetical protein